MDKKTLVVAGIVLACLTPTSWAAVLWQPQGLPQTVAEPTGIGDYAKQRTADLDTSSASAVKSAVLDIEARAVENMTAIRDALKGASNLSNLARASYLQAFPQGAAPGGVRTNLSVARSASGLGEATIALHAAVGRPLSEAERLAATQRAQQVAVIDPHAARAGALLAFAAVDAIRYREEAFRAFDWESWAIVEGNESILSTLHRRMNYSETAGDVAIVFDAVDQQVLDAASAATNSLDMAALVRAADVIAQALDEVRGLSPNGLTPVLADDACSTTHTVIFASPGCTIVVGDDADTTYPFLGDGRANVVLLDLGGNDRYKNTAGGGRWGVQVNADLGSGRDHYEPDDVDDLGGPLLGAATLGVGVLYDGGGPDAYFVHSDLPLEPIVTQGSGFAGVGLLLDEGGDDLYSVNHTGEPAYVVGVSELLNDVLVRPTHAQGAGAVGGVGILRDKAGHDDYVYSILDRPGNAALPTTGGGAQAYANYASIGHLLDHGLGWDNYTSGQSMNQAAASMGGFAFLHDEGGKNVFRVASSPGCAKYVGRDCRAAPAASYIPIAGWSQGYADTGGFAGFVAGSGSDHFQVLRQPCNEDANGETHCPQRSHEAHSLLGVGNTTGTAVLYNPLGADQYDASNHSFGYGNTGVGIFTDRGDTDTYLCSEETCYGAGESGGLGVYYDGVSADRYPPGHPPTSPWVRGALGIGVHSVPTGGGDGGDDGIIELSAVEVRDMQWSYVA